jgi:hypothetical protein
VIKGTSRIHTKLGDNSLPDPAKPVSPKGEAVKAPGKGSSQEKGLKQGQETDGAKGNQNPSGARPKRQVRWTLSFDTKDGEEYAKQLHALGAVLAIPEPGKDKEYRVFRDLAQRPVVGKVEDLTKIDRIYWIDGKPESVASLAKALGLKSKPDVVIAFFPEKLERELLSKELAFARKKEEDIETTTFKVVRKDDSYEVKAVSQR